MIAKIYGLSDPLTGAIRYIGWTFDLQRRLNTHIKRNPFEKTHKANWIRSLLRRELKPSIVILEECSKEIWAERERHWIAYGKKQGWNLTNGTEGGEGTCGAILSDETRKKQSEAKKGVLKSDVTKEKMREARRGIKNPRAKLTEMDVIEIRNLLSQRIKGTEIARQYNVTEDTISKIKTGRNWGA